MAIKPLDLPSAAGVEYGKGDVRHFAQGDAFDVPGVSNPTRQLAERDNLIGEKLNEAINVLNNQEQVVPMPLIRTIVPPSDETIVTNYRIPPGFESRVLNAAVSSVPASSDIELNVYYATGFGNNTGTSIVSTSTEFTGGVQFNQQGEFIITLKNKGAVTLEMAASVLLTLRPIGAEGTLLVGTVISGKQGPPGQRGGVGPIGPPGSGGAGSPGMIWKDQWLNGNPYNPNEVVRFDLYGSIASSYICRVAHVASLGVNDPQTDSTTTWNIVALGGATGTGTAGPTGPAGTSPVFALTVVNGTFTAGTDFTSETGTGDFASYTSGPLAGNSANVSLNECFIGTNPVSPEGASLLFGNFRLKCKGHGTITLPKAAFGAKVDYNNTAIECMAALNGTMGIDGDLQKISGVTVAPVSSDQYVINVMNGTNTPVTVSIFGVQQFN
jgi:hypothetical protein